MKRVIIMSPVPAIIILPSGGGAAKKNIPLMYKEPILPKCVSSQQTQAGWSTRCSLVQTVRSSTEPNMSHHPPCCCSSFPCRTPTSPAGLKYFANLVHFWPVFYVSSGYT